MLVIVVFMYWFVVLCWVPGLLFVTVEPVFVDDLSDLFTGYFGC